MKRDEDHIQETCVRWYRLVHRDKMITSFPAGYVFGGDATKRAILGKRVNYPQTKDLWALDVE